MPSAHGVSGPWRSPQSQGNPRIHSRASGGDCSGSNSVMRTDVGGRTAVGWESGISFSLPLFAADQDRGGRRLPVCRCFRLCLSWPWRWPHAARCGMDVHYEMCEWDGRCGCYYYIFHLMAVVWARLLETGSSGTRTRAQEREVPAVSLFRQGSKGQALWKGFVGMRCPRSPQDHEKKH